MSAFQAIALLLTAAWFLLIVIRFRRSAAVILGGMLAIGGFTLAAVLLRRTSLQELGLSLDRPWPATAGFGLGGLAVLLAYSPLADRLAEGLAHEPPDLNAFRAIQRSKSALVAGIAAAWIFGGFLEELIVRGIVLNSLAGWLSAGLPASWAAASAVLVAAVGAGLAHSYQGKRAMLITGQLSILLGALFVLSGFNLWAAILCHGLYDTIAFIRFARKQSRYSHLNREVEKESRN